MIHFKSRVKPDTTMTNFINCTPHTINLIAVDGTVTVLAKGTTVPRLAQTTKVVGELNGVSITETVFGETENLPEFQENVFLIVSRLILSANSNRSDLLVPNELVRDEAGNIVGCKSLARN